mmetsp:Transcript_21643/g.32217  ORF Transcript_21643/g.32217 Transcript_21643/m.32217 type:complete len:173 (+) Transcript_21643:104-622(+)
MEPNIIPFAAVIIAIFIARMLSTRLPCVINRIRRYFILDQKVVSDWKTIGEEISHLKSSLARLSVVDDFVKYSKTQRRIAKLQKTYDLLDSKVASTKLDWISKRIVSGFPEMFIILVANIFYRDVYILTFQALSQPMSSAFSLFPLFSFLSSGYVGVGAWTILFSRASRLVI